MADNGENGSDANDGHDGERDHEDCEEKREEENERRENCERCDRADSRADPPAGNVTLSLDATLELLANHDRRAIISYLRDASRRTATADELADHLVERRAERTGERPGRSHVLSTLHHIHIPKMVDAGVVDYDARTQEIRYWGSDRLERWHERIETSDEQ
ncbi:DUF7344 domain-containing protein [Halorussus pelagicus]|uniref:DUF7344 domain-containing protein n=1 Tax=Halorussus pelagicus TaxID=2505977 RepID=UPI000FFC2DD4|nr:hypothetical protein [Halorussus pelagicus]